MIHTNQPASPPVGWQSIKLEMWSGAHVSFELSFKLSGGTAGVLYTSKWPCVSPVQITINNTLAPDRDNASQRVAWLRTHKKRSGIGENLISQNSRISDHCVVLNVTSTAPRPCNCVVVPADEAQEDVTTGPTAMKVQYYATKVCRLVGREGARTA